MAILRLQIWKNLLDLVEPSAHFLCRPEGALAQEIPGGKRGPPSHALPGSAKIRLEDASQAVPWPFHRYSMCSGLENIFGRVAHPKAEFV